MHSPFYRFRLFLILLYLIASTLPSALAANPVTAHTAHFCGVGVMDDPRRLYRDSKHPFYRNNARAFASTLNVGQPRRVRLIYFLPTDRPYRPAVVQRLKDEMDTIQRFYADQMAFHGYVGASFGVETDAAGELVVHRVDGQHPDSHYLDGGTLETVFAELEQKFDFDTNIYLIVVDHRINGIIDSDGVIFGGFGGWSSKQSGTAWIHKGFDWLLIAHELGHSFGLEHDFRDGGYIMSYGPGESRLSLCHANSLSVHPYFNPDSPTGEGAAPTIELTSPLTYSAASTSSWVQLKVSDSEGLNQVILYTGEFDRYTVKQCRGLAGNTEAVIDFDYDGVIPAAHDPFYSQSTSLLNPLIHPLVVEVTDTDGNINGAFFVLLSDTVQPLMKIAGDNQGGLPSTPLPAPFVVEVRRLDDGLPLDGVLITFAVTAGGGSLSVERTETDFNGRAESRLTLGPTRGTHTVVVSAAGMGTVTFNAVAGAGVEIGDKNLRAAIETVLGKAEGTPIAPTEMASLTELFVPSADISDLTGLETATNLTWLYLEDNNISGISAVAGLTDLTALGLDSNVVSDLSPLTGLTNLTELYLGDNGISDLSPLAGLTQLTALGLDSNAISDLSPLTGLTNLTALYLWDNAISDLSPLVANTGLGTGVTVIVAENPLSDLSINTHIPALKSRGVTVEFGDTVVRSADINSDGIVNILDLVLVAAAFGATGDNLAGDVNGDGVVNILDLVAVAGQFQ